MESKFNTFVSTLNLVVCLFGYQFITSMFGSSITEDTSRMVTVPYRFFSLGLLLLTLIINSKEKIQLQKEVKILWLFWVLLLIRMFIDFYLRSDTSSLITNLDMKNKTVLFMFTNAIIPAYVMMKSYKHIDFNKLLDWCFITVQFSILYTIFFVNTAFIQTDSERLLANDALNSIATGHLGLSALILTIFILTQKRVGHIKWLLYVFIFIDFIFMLKAASRGPILASIGVIFVVTFSVTKRKWFNVFIIFLSIILILLLMNQIEALIHEISPALYDRFFNTSVDQLNGRDTLYAMAWEAFMKNPIIGTQFALYFGGSPWYAHNSILDTLMEFGLIGLFIYSYIIYKIFTVTINAITIRTPYFWLALLMIQSFISTMVSGPFYAEGNISIIYVLMFMSLHCHNFSLIKIYANPHHYKFKNL